MIPQLSRFKELIMQAGEKHQISPTLISAIIMQESAGEPWSYRFEPEVKYEVSISLYSKKLHISMDTERNFQHCSWGLMHIMGFKARELGFEEHLPQLLLPSYGLDWGCRALAGFSKKYNRLQDVIVSYNSGSPQLLPNGLYKNQSYLDGVVAWMKMV